MTNQEIKDQLRKIFDSIETQPPRQYLFLTGVKGKNMFDNSFKEEYYSHSNLKVIFSLKNKVKNKKLYRVFIPGFIVNVNKVKRIKRNKRKYGKQ